MNKVKKLSNSQRWRKLSTCSRHSTPLLCLCFHIAFITSITDISDNQVPHWLNYQIHPHHLSDDNGLHDVLNYVYFSHCSLYFPDIFNVLVLFPYTYVYSFLNGMLLSGINNAAHSDMWVTELYILWPLFFINIMHAILSMDTIHKIYQVFLHHISFKGILCVVIHSWKFFLLHHCVGRFSFFLIWTDPLSIKLLNKILLIAITMYFTMGNSNVLFGQEQKFHIQPKSCFICHMYETE